MEPLARIVAPFDVEILLAALRGEPTLFDIDGRFEPSHMGTPVQSSPGPRAFDGKAFVAAAQAIAWFAAGRPVGDPLRAKVPELYAKVVERLANPALLLMGGFSDGPSYIYFGPSRLTPEERIVLENVTYPVWKSETFPWPGVYGVYKACTSDPFVRLVERIKTSPLTDGMWEADPRASVPELVREAIDRLKLSEDAATLFLQLLTLADCTDQDVCATNDWKSDRLKQAGAELASVMLVVKERKLRAGRDYALPGVWEKLRPPQPGIEREKLALYSAPMIDEIPAAPLGRILPLAPLTELFATAWSAQVDRAERKPRPLPSVPRACQRNRAVTAIAPLRSALARARPAAKSAGDKGREDELIAAIVRGDAEDPNDDGPRLVYADLLTERDDRRGELIVLACALAREHDMAKRHRFDQLLEDPETTGVAFAQQHVTNVVWDRGFIIGVHMKLPTFTKYGPRLVKEHPLLRSLVVDAGVRRIPDIQLERFAACEALAQISELDFADHFVHSAPFIRFLASPHLKLRSLRIGANTRGGGIGKSGLAAIATCAALGDLRSLELPGQRVGDGGATAFAKNAKNLPKLEVLRLPMNDISDAGAIALLDAPALRGLRILEVDDLNWLRQHGRVFGPRENRLSSAVIERIAADPRTGR